MLINLTPTKILLFSFLLLLVWFAHYLFLLPTPSVDLHGHLAAIQHLANSLSSLSISHYNPFSFAGYPAFQFYGFLPHFLTAIIYKILPIDLNLIVIGITILTLSLLPLNFYFSAKTFLSENLQNTNAKLLLAWSSLIFSFWFLNIPESDYGFGSSAIIHTGLYSQLFAWHLLLLSTSTLYKLAINPNTKTLSLHLAFSSLLILTHPLTAFLSYCILASVFIFKIKYWKYFITCTLVPALITLPWWINIISLSEYSNLGVSIPERNFFSIFFNQTLAEVFLNIVNLFQGKYQATNLTYYLIWFLILSIPFNKNFLKSKIATFNLISLMVLGLIFSENVLTTVLQLDLHYYRFYALISLLLVPVLMCSFTCLLAEARQGYKKTIALGIVLICFTTTVSLPSIEYLYSKQEKAKNLYQYEDEVIKLISEDSTSSKRVFLEYFNNYNLFDFISPHYIPANLNMQKIETLNGLFIQSSSANIFYNVAARALGLNYYANNPFFYKKGLDLTYGLELLSDFGVSHIVITNPVIANKLKGNKNLDLVKKYTPYYIFRMHNQVQVVAPVKKTLVGFHDETGTIPFKLIQYYFSSEPALYNNFEIIELSKIEKPPELDILIVNSFNSSPKQALNISVTLSRNSIEKQYQYLKNTFDTEIKEKLLSNIAFQKQLKDRDPILSWSDNYQSMQIKNLDPTLSYRLNYSFSPRLQCQNCSLYRGQSERMILVPQKREVRVEFH